MVATTSRNVTKDASDPAPRKRGRPRKSSTAENIPVQKNVESAPRKRGRPPKIQSDSAQAAPPQKTKVDAAPRKRGRPPKDKSIETPAAKSSLDTAAPRKRGRPPKDKSIDTPAAKLSSQTAVPRKRGRPSKADKEAAAAAKKGETATLRKSTVPPKNAKPAYVVDRDAQNKDSGSETDAGQDADTEDVDRPRKRARKDAPTGASVQPKRRGRPPKVHSSDASAAVKTTVKSAAHAEPAKRRGRPPKHAAKEPVASTKAPRKVARPSKVSKPAGAEVAAQPKRRGRPPKVRPESTLPSKDSKDSSNDETTLDTGSVSALDSGADQPRKRGRPPKTQETRPTDAPKKRGRPPKQPQQLKEQQEEKEAEQPVHEEQKEQNKQDRIEQEEPEKAPLQKQQDEDDEDSDVDAIKNPPLSAPANGSSDIQEMEPPLSAPIRIADAPKRRGRPPKLVPVVEIALPKAAGLPEEPLKKMPDFNKPEVSDSELSEGWVSSGMKLAKKVVDLL
ncbi:hypothetical protein LPJ53_001032 [Coemansia erecta]|uniref:Uncharacterized protein n=1 Tax=Coemansia erecta TaxID=147472 RepID=A0A9W8CT91_9FUNG|nr:hypothetical protein LPJ53_001032 [Coemansia erecta]